jgi:hypothetical protein
MLRRKTAMAVLEKRTQPPSFAEQKKKEVAE